MEFLNNLLGDLGNLSAASPVLAALRAVIAILLVFFLPGFAWTLLFFKRINRLERIGLSIALSIALVTLSMLGLNLALGVRVSASDKKSLFCRHGLHPPESG